MKNFFLIIVLSSLTLIGKAQGNLQFNQVLTYNGNLVASVSNTSSSPTYTCPAGKVWKIESKTRTPKLVGGLNGILRCYLNTISLEDLYYQAPNAIMQMIDNSPLWLKAGDSIYFVLSNEFINNMQPQTNANTSYYLSIIEYNIVP